MEHQKNIEHLVEVEEGCSRALTSLSSSYEVDCADFGKQRWIGVETELIEAVPKNGFTFLNNILSFVKISVLAQVRENIVQDFAPTKMGFKGVWNIFP